MDKTKDSQKNHRYIGSVILELNCSHVFIFAFALLVAYVLVGIIVLAIASLCPPFVPRPMLRRDSQGLRAVHQCREALTEYHLHYCTSSEFDSVLFLATLEGHRAVTQPLKHHTLGHHVGSKNNGHYNPFSPLRDTNSPLINDANLHSPYTQQLGAHFAFKSMFSPRGQQTMRLQRIGEWIAYHVW